MVGLVPFEKETPKSLILLSLHLSAQTHSKNATVCSTKMEPSPDAEPAGRPACSTVRSTRPVFGPPGLKSCAVSALTKMAT